MLDKIRLWLSLVKFSHTLFALPFALSGMLMAANGLPDVWVIAYILLCMVSARSAAMAWNRFVDRDIDAQNPRTRSRHLPAGLVSPKAVVGFTILSCTVFVASAAALNKICLLLSPVALLLVLGYSHLKRFTALCHFGLGLAIGISPLAAWIAVRGDFGLPPILLGAALWLWLAGFDIVYATQDESFDRATDLHSIPAKLGRTKSLRLAVALHIPVPILLLLGGMAWQGTIVWWTLAGLVSVILIWVHGFRQSDDLELNNGMFRANIAISLLVLFATVAQLGIERFK